MFTPPRRPHEKKLIFTMARPLTITLRVDHLEFINITIAGIRRGLQLADAYLEQAMSYFAHIMAGRDPDAPRRQWTLTKGDE